MKIDHSTLFKKEKHFAWFYLNNRVFLSRNYSRFSCDVVIFIADVKITLPSEVGVLSDMRRFRNLTFYNVLAWQGSSFWNRACLNFKAFALHDIKWRPEKAVVEVKRWLITLVFANCTVLVLEEVLNSACRSSREITFRFNSKTQCQMFLLLYGCHVIAHLVGHEHGVSIPSSIDLGETLFRITHEWKTAETYFLARMNIYQSPTISQIFYFIYFLFLFILFPHYNKIC